MIHEKAFSEILRVCLQYEQVFLNIEAVIQRKMGYEYALAEMVTMIQMLERHDFKTKLLSELYALERMLQSYEQESVDVQLLKGLLADVYTARNQLTTKSTVASKVLLSDPLLSKLYFKHKGVDASLSQKSWHCQSDQSKCEQLSYWLSISIGYQNAVKMILHIYRGLSQFEQVDVKSGFYKKSFLDRDLKQVYLVRIQCKDTRFWPTISMTKRWLSATFYESKWEEKKFYSIPSQAEITIQVAICSTHMIAQGTG